MTGSFSVIFKGQMIPDIYLFEVMAIEDNLTKSTVVGSVIINAKDKCNMKSYIQGHNCMDGMVNAISQECMSSLNNILKFIE